MTRNNTCYPNAIQFEQESLYFLPKILPFFIIFFSKSLDY